MAGSIYLIQNDGKLQAMTEQPYKNEELLQLPECETRSVSVKLKFLLNALARKPIVHSVHHNDVPSFANSKSKRRIKSAGSTSDSNSCAMRLTTSGLAHR